MSPLQMLVCSYPTLLILLPGCRFCIKAMDLLNQRGIPYNTVYNHQAPAADGEVSTRFDYHTYPKIFLNGEFIGGYSNLEKKLSSGYYYGAGNPPVYNKDDIGFYRALQTIY